METFIILLLFTLFIISARVLRWIYYTQNRFPTNQLNKLYLRKASDKI
jgi:hypothetical protein